MDEVFALQDELRSAKAEQQRLAGMLREMEAANKRQADELRAYREAMDRREEEYRQVRLMEEKRLVQVVEEYRRRFELERQRLVQALERNHQLTRTIASILPEFAAVEREVRPTVDPLPGAAARTHGGPLSHHAGGDRDQPGGYKSAYDSVINTAQPGPSGGARVGTGRPEEAYT